MEERLICALKENDVFSEKNSCEEHTGDLLPVWVKIFLQNPSQKNMTKHRDLKYFTDLVKGERISFLFEQ